MSKSLAGKVALVTGGSRGIGAAAVKALADLGANVAFSYAASADKAEALARELETKGVKSGAFKADQGKPAQPDFRDAYRTQLVLDAVLDSANGQQWVKVKQN